MFDSVLTEPVWKKNLRRAIDLVKAIPPNQYDQSAFEPSHDWQRCGCAAHHIYYAFCAPEEGATLLGNLAYAIAPDNALIALDLQKLFAKTAFEHVSEGKYARDRMVEELTALLNRYE